MSGFMQEYGKTPARSTNGTSAAALPLPGSDGVRARVARGARCGRQEGGRRIALSADTFALPAGNLYYGLDVATWVDEGLVDRLHPWGKIRGQPPVDMGHYRGLVEGSRTELWPHLRVWDDGTDAAYNEYRKEALSLYDAGAAGLAIWDAATSTARA